MKFYFMKVIMSVIVFGLIILGGYFVVQKDDPVKSAYEPIRIGGAFALTGVGAAIGTEESKGALLAVKEINESGGILGRKIEFIEEDVSIDKANTNVSAVKKLIEMDKVRAIIGPTWDEPAEQIVSVVEEAHIPLVGADLTSNIEAETNYSYVFSTWYNSRVGVRELLRFVKEKEWNDIAIIRPIAGGFWQFTRDILLKHKDEFGINVVADENTGDFFTKDYRTFILKVLEKKPEAIFIVISDPTECLFLKQLTELNSEIPVLSTESAGNDASLKDCPNLLERLYFSAPRETSSSQNFSDSFQKTYGRDPQFPSAFTAYNAVKMVARALEVSNLGEGGSLRDALSQSKEFDTKGYLLTSEDAFQMFTAREGEFVPSFLSFP